MSAEQSRFNYQCFTSEELHTLTCGILICEGSNVLKHLCPVVVLLEEAAERDVLAALSSNLQHLILMGDHQQLRPQVESYDLDHCFVSLPWTIRR
jgi:hypothetical protein